MNSQDFTLCKMREESHTEEPVARSVERACENKGMVSNTQVVPYCARLHVALAILAPMSQRVYALTCFVTSN